MLIDIFFWTMALTGVFCWLCLLVMIWFIWKTDGGRNVTND